MIRTRGEKMYIKATEQLIDKLNVNTSRVISDGTMGLGSALENWHADTFILNRRKAVVLINDATFLTVVLWPLKKEEWVNIDNLVNYAVQELWEELGLDFHDQKQLFPDKTGVFFASETGRSGESVIKEVKEKLKFLPPRLLDEEEVVQMGVMRKVNESQLLDQTNSSIERFVDLLNTFGFKEIKPSLPPSFELKIEIKLPVDDPVVRVVSVPLTYTFKQLHEIIQKVFMWGDSHLHDFQLKKEGEYTLRLISPIEEVYPSRKEIVRLEENVQLVEHLEIGKTFKYVYDYGDHWEHEIKVVKKVEKRSTIASLIDLIGEPIPEDVGGVYGYQEFKEAMEDEKHLEHNDYKHWASRYLSLKKFHTIERINKDLFVL